MAPTATSMSRASSGLSAGAGIGRSWVVGVSAGSAPTPRRRARTLGKRAASRAVSSGARRVSSESHGELSTITSRQPLRSRRGRARRATSAPATSAQPRRMASSTSRSRNSGTAPVISSRTGRGVAGLTENYHTPVAHRREPVKLTRSDPTFIVASHMAKPRRGDVLALAIDDLAFGGEGVGRVDGYVLFVRGGVPGDRLRVRVIETRARYGRGVIEAVDVPAPGRIEPPCPYFGVCGGCRLQHVAYEAQLAFKQKQVRDCLERLGAAGAFELRPILPAPAPYAYRNKMEFTVAGATGAAVVGLHAAD